MISQSESQSRINKLTAIFFTLAGNASGQWDIAESVCKKSDVYSLLNTLDWLKSDPLYVCSLKSYPDCRRLMRDGRLLSVKPRMSTWGIAWNGWCFTRPVCQTRGVGEGCSLAGILIPDAPERYFLSEKQMEKLLYRAHKNMDETDMTTDSDTAENSVKNSDDGGKETA